MQNYHAPWTALLKFVTVLVAAILLSVGGVIAAQTDHPVLRVASIALPFVAIMLGGAFMVRGYEIQGNRLVILRPGWTTSFDLQDLAEATHDPKALRRSLRLFGNGGFFAFVGWFRSKQLGVYRLFGTDPERAVVLKFRSQRTIVVTPDQPEDFVRELRGRIKVR